nr:YcxB family protein [uncultured Niameybacter sp.]
MYKFGYNLDEADYIDFNIYHVNNSKQVKKTLLVHRIVGALVIILGGYLYTHYKDVLSIVVYGTATILWGIFYPKLFFKSTKNNLKKMINEGTDMSLFKYREVVINDVNIIEEIFPDESMKRWTKVIKIGESDENIFIYVSDLEALIIPKKIVGTDSEILQFINDIKKQFSVG